LSQVALSLEVSPSTLARLLNGDSNISPVMALRLAKTSGRSPESWLALQDQYDLWHAKRTTNLKKVKPLLRSLRAGREAVARGVTPLGKDPPFPARRALRATTSRPAEHVNINWKGY